MLGISTFETLLEIIVTFYLEPFQTQALCFIEWKIDVLDIIDFEKHKFCSVACKVCFLDVSSSRTIKF